MAINIKQNRENLYKSLISQGFFVDDNGNPELTLADFGEQVDDAENASALYENLVDLGIFADAEGKATMTLDDFMRKIHGSYCVRESYPLTENQRGLYIDWEMNRDTTQYNVPALLKVSGADAEKLRDALAAVIDSHPGLKARFAMQDGDVVQLRNDDEPAEVTLTRVENEPDTAYFQSKVRPFDLLNDRLYRIEIIQTPTALYLFKDFHHIVFDGFSNVVFMDNLKAALKGENLAVETFTSFDHALDEQKELEGEAFAEAESYFDNLLASSESTVYPHSGSGTTTANLGTMEFSVASQAIDDFCRQQGLTSNSFFMTALAQLLNRATREEKVLFSTINNGRTDEAMMDITGMFVKTLPVCSIMEMNKAQSTTIAEQMKVMQQQLNETEKRMFYPFTRMAERHHLIPQVLYVYHGRVNAEENESVSFEEMPLSLDMVKMPLTVTVYNKTGNSYTILLTYQPSFYSAADMERLGKAFCAACNSMLTAQSIAAISLLDDEERKLVESFHSSAKAEVPFKLFYEPLEANAIQIPERKALVAKDRTLTFAELNVEANKVAHALMRKGIKRGDRVVLLLPRTSAVIVCMFGVSKAGGAYIPCDPEYPADRINLIMNDSEAQYVITTKEHAEAYPAEKVILIDDIYGSDNAVSGDEENPKVEVTPEDLAYLIYTSGSTGRPKGVMLRHVGITNYLYDHPANIHIHGLKELDVKSYVCITTLSFDMSLKEFAGSIFNGITAVLADEQEVMDAHLLANLMKRTGAEAINGTCSRILTYLELDEFREALSHCKMVWSGGELFPKQLLTDLQKLGVRILNTYGPTEITVSSNIGDLSHAEKVTVGRPLLNYEEFIVDQFENELPVGFVGEMLIGGPGVAAGYNNLPEMTAERFVEYHGKRVYRSGDLARWETDGQVEIMGRNDGQVKLRGFRVELGEIEGLAAKFEGIRQAVADIKKIGAAQMLCLYYTSEAAIDEEALKAFLAASLTEYMVPSAFMRIEAIPLTPNGKTNRKALPNPQMRQEECVAPANDLEATLLTVVKELLKTDEIGVTTNLMTAGLNSIASMRMSAILLQHHNMDLRVRDIMQSPTIRDMVTRLSTNANRDDKHVAHPVQKYYPLSETQRGIFIDWSMNPKALQYNIPHVMKFNVLDVNKMKKAIQEVIAAHPFMKTRITAQGDDFVQVRDDAAFVPEVEVEKLAFEPDTAFFQSQVKPFDLLNDQLFRFKIYVSPTAWYMLVDIHHVISDGTSNNILARDIERAYRGEKLEKEDYTAFDLALDEQQLLHSERGENAEKYFDNLLEGLDATVYPASTQVDGEANYGELRVEIDASDEIRSFCTQHAIAPSSFFLQVFHQVLHRVTREEQTLVYFISNGRSEMQLEHFFGVNVKTLPTVVSDFKAPVADSVKALHEQMLDTISNDFYPFTKMVERHGLKAEIQYNYMVDIQTKVILNGASDTVVPLSFDTAKTPLAISIFNSDSGKFECFIEYDANIYNANDINILSEMFCGFARNCIQPEYKLMSEVPLLSRYQMDSVKAMSQGEKLDYDATKTYPDLFREQAEKTPDSLAVIDEAGSYTYSELDRVSNAIALKLRELGIGSAESDSPFVGVMLDRQKEFIASAIGIEKAGGAYVPLDHAYPVDRLMYMIEDSGSQVLVTSHAIFDAKTSEGGSFVMKNILFVDDFIAEIGDKTFEATNHATPDSLAYMIYTSGSTGKPKGVMIPQRAKVSFVHAIIKILNLNDQVRGACYDSFSFDASLQDLYPTLLVGAVLHIVPESIRKDIDLVYDFMVKNQITVGDLPTQFAIMMLQLHPDIPLEILSMGGEKMSTNPDCKCRLFNWYGPTEFTVDSTYYETIPGQEYRNIPIGRPLDNLAAFVVDGYGHLVPQGVCGELCMAGPQMAAGYWKREELTDERFVYLTIGDEKVKVYHTGDLVRYNEENQLEYYGRIDSQVKLRGFRIELGEIESQIASFEGVHMVSVQVKEVSGVQHLCAYYSADGQIDTNALKEYLAKQLTDYMVPTVYMQLDQLPMTPNGKVNTKALPMPEIVNDVEYVEPSGTIEKAIAEAFAQVLQIDAPIGALDSFFNYGGDSIKSIRLVSILRQQGIVIQVADVMQQKTVRGIAGTVGESEAIEVNQEAWSGEVPNSAIEDYFFDAKMPKPEHYNQSVFLKHKSRFDKKALEQAFTAICTHHDMLRAVVRDGHLFVRPVSDGNLFVLKEYNLDNVTDTNSANNEIETLANELQSTIDLDNGPLVHLGLFHFAGFDALLIVIHHTVIDGVSWRILLEDLQTAYGQTLSGQPVQLPQKTHSYKEYAEAMQRYKASYKLSLEKDYWQKVRQQYKKIKMSDGADHNRDYDALEINLDADFTRQLLALPSDKSGLEINDILLCALGRSYQKVTGEDALSVLLEGHGREPIHETLYIDRTVGWFTSTYPVLLQGLGKDIANDMAKVKQTLRSIPNKGLGYGQIFGMDINPMPLVTFNYLGEFGNENASSADFGMAEDLPMGETAAKENRASSDITINSLVQPSGQFSLTMRFNKALLTSEQASSLVNGIADELHQITASVDKDSMVMTPSDLGETEWSLEEYNAIVNDFASRDEKLSRIYPLSTMQQGMLLKAIMEPDSLAYRIVSIIELSVVPTEKQLRKVLDRLAVKYETLRTAIIYKGVEAYRQAIVEGRQLSLTMLDYSDHKDIESDLLALRQDLLKNAFDLQTKPLYGFVSVKLADDRSALLMVNHHIMNDGWSMPVFVKDFFGMLGEEISGKAFETKTSGLDGKYESYIREILAKDQFTGLEYWKKLLEDYDTKAVIKGENVPLEEQSKLDSVNMSLQSEDAALLKDFCAKMQVTPNSVVELAWSLVLSSYNRTNDVVFAKVVSGRDNTEEDVSELVGIFINTIPIRMTFKDEMTVAEGVTMVHRQAAESNRYDYCNLSEVQKLTSLGSDLFQSILVFENYPADEDDISSGLPFTFRPLITKDENFDELSLTAFVSDDGRLGLNIKFDKTMFREQFVRDLIAVFGNLVHGIISNPDAKLSSLPLLDKEMTDRIMAVSTGKHLDVDITKTFAQAFVERAALCPDSPAVYDANSHLTYKQMDDYSNKFAHILIEKGVQPNSFVCVLLDRTKEFPMTVLAIHKAGAAYTPLDFEYPNERLCYMIENSQAKVLVTTHDVLDAKQKEGEFNFGDAQVIFLDELDFEKGDFNDTPINLTTPDNLAYMIYTSGSTGKPKGAMLHQAGLWNFINVVIDMEELTAEDRIEGHRSFSFDAHIEDLYAVLTLGGSFHVMPSEIRKDLPAIHDFLVSHQITGGGYSTAIAALLLNTYDDLPVRFITAGGEKLDGVYSNHVEIINVYGPTECTDDTSYYKIEPGRTVTDIPIGKSVANNWNFIIDAHGHLLPQGVAGELCFAGVQVGRGYWQLPERTGQVFGDCPFVAKDAWGRDVRMYHTGDLCRWNEDGDLEFLGRIDFQVKLRGFRIELGEIESRTMAIEGVRQAAAEVKRINGTDHLILYYTLQNGTNLDEDGIHDALKTSSLADYMIPDAYMRMEEMPLTPNGKINRKLLPIPEIKAEEIVAPASKIETDIFNIASELLKTDQFGVTTNLISAGMTSLLAMRMSAAIGQQLGFEINTRELLTNPTIRHLAELAESGAVKKTSSMRLGTSNAQPEQGEPTTSKPASANPLQKRPGSNPLAKRNDTEETKKTNNPLLKR